MPLESHLAVPHQLSVTMAPLSTHPVVAHGKLVTASKTSVHADLLKSSVVATQPRPSEAQGMVNTMAEKRIQYTEQPTRQPHNRKKRT